MIEVQAFKEKLKNKQGCFPLLTLEDFFADNINEDAIAPNQWGYGRPHLSEMHETYKKLERMQNVAWVRVALHNDTEIYYQDGKEVLYLSGDSIVLCTTLLPDEVESIVNCKWLCSDGVVEKDYMQLTNIFSEVPDVPEGYTCMEIVWD